MINLTGVEKVYRTSSVETLALRNINLQISKGDFLAIMGPSGSGKSTLLNLMGLLDEPSEGRLEFEGKEVNSFSDKKKALIRNRHIGFIFQSFHLIADLTVLDNVSLPLLYRNMSGAKRKDCALDALAKVGLSNRVKHFPSQLSGGQSQRVAIARAIVGKPSVILADEPTGNLDSAMGEEIMKILMSLHEEDGTSIVMVTHDEHLARKTSRTIRLFDGSQVQ